MLPDATKTQIYMNIYQIVLVNTWYWCTLVEKKIIGEELRGQVACLILLYQYRALGWRKLYIFLALDWVEGFGDEV